MTANESRSVAPAGTACPICGLDVSGFACRTTAEGQQAWDRPASMEGLTHVAGGRRCLPHAIDPVAPATQPERRTA